jgi:hypothetical protein
MQKPEPPVQRVRLVVEGVQFNPARKGFNRLRRPAIIADTFCRQFFEPFLSGDAQVSVNV